jgi:hypothetical protein
MDGSWPGGGEGAETRQQSVGGKLRAVVAAVGLLAVGLVVSVLFGVVFTVPLVLFGADLTGSAGFLALAAVGQLGFLAVGLFYARRVEVFARPPTRREVVAAGGGLVAVFVLALGLSGVAAAAGLAPGGSVFDDPIAADPTVALGLAVLSIVLVAPAEELLFRGVIQGRLRRSFGPVASVAGSSLVFGSIHLVNFTGSVAGALVGVAVVTAGGAVFGVLYERTQNLVVPIITHASYNALLLVLAFLAA